MKFFITMFVCNLFIPAVMLVAGISMQKHPPKNINGFLGYRTARSMKNKDTWLFAHETCGQLWKKIGFVLLPLSVLVQLPFVHADTDRISSMTLILEAIQIAVLLVSIYPVEKALKTTFDEAGNHRENSQRKK